MEISQMSKSILIRSAAAALLAVALAPAAVAQGPTRAAPGFAPGTLAGGQPVCTQLELSIGLSGDECGKLTLSEIAQIKSFKDNTN
jgi:hypothetical protein